MKFNRQHGGWLFGVYYSSPTHWAYIATQERTTKQTSGEVKAFDAEQAIAAVIGLIDSGNLQ